MRNVGSLFIALYVFAGAAQQARATLGEEDSSVERDRQALQATSNPTSADSSGQYTVHALSVGGVSIREYVSSANVVFAITWQGIRPPDLSLLLGSYYSELSAVTVGAERGMRSPTVRTANLVVRRSGHMRNLRGKAFAPALVPAGVTPEALP